MDESGSRDVLHDGARRQRAFERRTRLTGPLEIRFVAVFGVGEALCIEADLLRPAPIRERGEDAVSEFLWRGTGQKRRLTAEHLCMGQEARCDDRFSGTQVLIDLQ